MKRGLLMLYIPADLFVRYSSLMDAERRILLRFTYAWRHSLTHVQSESSQVLIYVSREDLPPVAQDRYACMSYTHSSMYLCIHTHRRNEMLGRVVALRAEAETTSIVLPCPVAVLVFHV